MSTTIGKWRSLGVGLLVVNGLTLSAQNPAFNLWTPDQMSKAGALATYHNGLTTVAHREASGGCEKHTKDDDLFVIQSGEATLIVGGELLDEKATTRPNEMTGTSIRGGTTVKLTPGVVVHIAAGVPHQMLLDAGKQITYFVLKVTNP